MTRRDPDGGSRPGGRVPRPARRSRARSTASRFDWRKGEILGVVGESGCGKSTLARAMLSLVEPAAGEVALDGQQVNGKRSLDELRRRLQMIFQDPYQTLNPRQRVRTIVAEPLRVQGVDRGEHDQSGCGARSTTSASTTSASASAIRTSSPAASASAWRSPRRWCSSPTG